MQSDELHVLELVTARLDAAGIAYMLSGTYVERWAGDLSVAASLAEVRQ